ncbi:MAG: Re/Si-specific NAD(P)(+) transhydrogenase subunit alpha [Thermodesulfobacteriota bacterium]
MIIGVPVETYLNEKRVALVPALVPTLTKIGMEVLVEKGAGEKAGFADAEYEKQGARIVQDRNQLFSQADVLLQVRGLGANPETVEADLEVFRSGQLAVGLFNPLVTPANFKLLAERGVITFALELLPRISRAQSMDVLSSMASIAGYKAALLAAGSIKKMFPMMITAAGMISPAKVFVIGAGVAGLQAIATCKRLGASMQAYDVRPAVKEQVESLGAKFVELELQTKESETSGGYAKAMDEEFYRRQRELMSRVVAECDAVITTAAVPGKKAPVLITEEMVKGMKLGSVIVDLAAESGGNCELTKPGEIVEAHGVSINGPLNLPSTIPYHASQMYAKNIATFIQNLLKNGGGNFDLEDQIVRDTLITHKGEVVNAQVRELLGLPALVEKTEEKVSGS